MQKSLISCVCLLLPAACHYVPPTSDASTSADASVETAPPDTALPDAATAETLAEIVQTCTAAQLAACDDGNPCTADTCALGGACSHASAPNAPCNDSDPCTVEDACGDAGCKGKKKTCDDNSPCTIDACELDGSCTNKPNMHYDCLPLVQVDYPPRGLRWSDPNGKLAVKGKVVTQKAPFKALQLQGQPVAVQPDGTFSANLQMLPGSNWLTFKVTDVFGGERVRVQGLHWAPAWSKGSVPAGALALGTQLPATFAPTAVDQWAGALNAAWKGAQFAVPPPFGGKPVLASWGLQGSPSQMGLPCCSGVVALTGDPQPLPVLPALAATLTADPGTPILCDSTPLAGAVAADGKLVQLVLGEQAWNAALRAAWLAGGYAGDISATTADVAPAGIEIAANASLQLPWLLKLCGPEAPELQLAELRVSMLAPADAKSAAETLAEGDVHISLKALATFKIKDGKLQLGLGALQSAAADFELRTGSVFGTDIQEGLLKATLEQALPKLVAAWQKAPLVELPLPAQAQIGPQKVNWAWTAAQVQGGAVRAVGN